MQSPENPAKLKPDAAEALSVTDTSGANVAEQMRGQSIAAGVETTVPLPEIWTDTVTGRCVNVADAAASARTASVQPCPAQAPPKPLKSQPGEGEG